MNIVRFSYACQANWGWVMWLVSLARTSWRHVFLRTTVSRIDVLGLAYTVLPRIMLPVPRPYVQNCCKMHVLVRVSILRPRDLLTNHYFPIYNAELNTGQSYMDASLDLALDASVCTNDMLQVGKKLLLLFWNAGKRGTNPCITIQPFCLLTIHIRFSVQ